MILIAMLFNTNEGKTGNGGDAPKKFLGPHLLSLRKVPFLLTRGHSKTDAFIPLLKRVAVQTPKTLLVALLKV